jgi:cation diffusion facilitator CzcD-associated flavoprotein CzcO
MFFCHAWNQQQKQQRQEQDQAATDGASNCPNVPHRILRITCFERHATPGGVWRNSYNKSPNENNLDEDDKDTPTATPGADAVKSVYDELWTNGACQALEFYDYTLNEHFQGMSIPVYLPRRDINEYILQRVTKDAPTFFEDYFEFNTEVVRVQECEELDESFDGAFQVTIRNVKTGVLSTRSFDKCIWAAGENGRPSIPAPLREIFRASSSIEGSDGENDLVIEEKKMCEPTPRLQLLHSAETTKIKKVVPDQRILLIGGAFSAEDLALQCLKWGAAHIDIVTRSNESEITWTASWPGDRVVVHSEMGIQSVEKDGTIVLEKMAFDWPYRYRSASSSETNDENQSHHANLATDSDDPSHVCLSSIDIVIFCTGYQVDLSMIDESLRPTCGKLPAWFMGMDDSMNLLNDPEFSWSTWEMDPTNIAQKYTGMVPAGQGRMVRFNYNHPDMHRGILFKNPNMMYLCEHGSDIPLLSLDIHAWLLCSYLSGRIPTPSVEELKAANRQQVLDQMNLPYLRYFMDEGYYKVLNEVEPLNKKDCGYWPKDKDAEKCVYWDASSQYTNYMFRLLARVMEEGQYPGISFGSYHKLNKHGKALIDFGLSSYYMRSDLSAHPDGHEWRTFRDDTVEPEYIYSLYTGHEARPLRKRWMEIRDASSSIKNGDL